MTADVNSKEMDITRLLKQLSDYETATKKLTGETTNKQNKSDQLEKALHDIKKDGLENTKKLKHYYESICTELKTKVNTLTDEADAHEKNADQLANALNNVKKNNVENANKLRSETQKLKELEQELAEINEDHNMALENEQVQVEGLSGDLKETKKANKELRRKFKHFTRENAELEERYKNLVVDFTRLKRQR